MADITGFNDLLKFATDIFKGVDLGAAAQRAIVGGSILSCTTIAYGTFVRPSGGPDWLYGRARQLTSEADALHRDVAINEGRVAAMKTALDAALRHVASPAAQVSVPTFGSGPSTSAPSVLAPAPATAMKPAPGLPSFLNRPPTTVPTA